MKASRSWLSGVLIFAVILLVGLCCVIAWLPNEHLGQESDLSATETTDAPIQTAAAAQEQEVKKVAAATDVAVTSDREHRHPGIQEQAYYDPKPGEPFGKVKPVHVSEHESVAAVHKALQPESRDVRQLTVLAEPEPWDREAYSENPAAYTKLSVPARAFRPAQPAAGVPRLQRIGASSVDMHQGDTIQLQVRTQPFMPVTFTSMDMGRFGNQLTSQTVAADKLGIASVHFIGSTGTLYDADIQAASPVASGTVRWVVHIKPTVDVFADMNATAQQASVQAQ